MNAIKIQFLIWNHERGMYWTAGRRGYTSDRRFAGLYDLAEATAIAADANIKVDDTDRPQETLYPVANPVLQGPPLAEMEEPASAMPVPTGGGEQKSPSV